MQSDFAKRVLLSRAHGGKPNLVRYNMFSKLLSRAHGGKPLYNKAKAFEALLSRAHGGKR